MLLSRSFLVCCWESNGWCISLYISVFLFIYIEAKWEVQQYSHKALHARSIQATLALVPQALAHNSCISQPSTALSLNVIAGMVLALIHECCHSSASQCRLRHNFSCTATTATDKCSNNLMLNVPSLYIYIYTHTHTHRHTYIMTSDIPASNMLLPRAKVSVWRLWPNFGGPRASKRAPK